MNELDELIRQKREIERKIKALKNNALVVGDAKIDIERYPTEKPDKHFLAVRYKADDEGRERWQKIYSAVDRESVVNRIPEIVDCLQELYSKEKENK